MLRHALLDDTPIFYKYSYNFPSLPGYFFLPAHARIFPWAGKNKSGYRGGNYETWILENYRRMKKRFLSHLMKRFVKWLKSASFEEMLYKKGCVTDLWHTLLFSIWKSIGYSEKMSCAFSLFSIIFLHINFMNIHLRSY